jgi:YVTN family beta-propeller protein
VGSYGNSGSFAFPWGPSGTSRAAQTINAPLSRFPGFRFLGEEPKRKNSPAAKFQNTVGSDIYFVGAPENSLTVLDSETATQLAVIPVGTDPRWIEVSPDQSKAYISNFGSDSITVIDTATRSADQTIDLAAGSSPMGIAPSPDGHRVYVVNSNMNSLSVVDVDTGVVVATSDAGDGATHVAVSPDGQLAYVTNQNAGTVSVFDTLSMDLVTTISGIPGATSVTFESHGLKAYVTGSSSGSGKLYVISTTDHTVGGTVSVGSDPVSVRLSPYGTYFSLPTAAPAPSASST